MTLLNNDQPVCFTASMSNATKKKDEVSLMQALQLKLSFVRGRVACWLVRLTPHPASSFGQGVSLCFEVRHFTLTLSLLNKNTLSHLMLQRPR